MISFHAYPISRKLILISMVSTASALVLASVALIIYDIITTKKLIREELSILTTVIGDSSSGTLIFHDTERASKNLATLKAQQSIVSACLYTLDGNVIATYSRGDNGTSVCQPIKLDEYIRDEDGIQFNDSKMHQPDTFLIQPIFLDGELIGAISVLFDTSEIQIRIYNFIAIVSIIFLLAVGAAFFLSARLQRVISEPISQLGQTAKHISENNDYSIRAIKHNEDELGVLVVSFNNMLNKIEQQNAALIATKEEAEKAVVIAETTLENMGQGILMVDGQDHILIYNDQLLNFLNISQDKASDCETFEEFIQLGYHPSEESATRSLNLARSGDHAIYEATLKDGKILEVRQNPLAEGGFVKTYTDITERKKSEETLRRSQQLLEGVIENSSALIYVKDVKGKYILINRELERIMGMKREDAVGLDAFEIWPKEMASNIVKNEKAVIDNAELVSCEETSDGKTTYLSLKFPLFNVNGEVDGICGISTNITEQKQLQRELTQSKQAAESSTEAKASFLAAMSHEIRTPMNGVIGMVDLLRQTELDGDQKQMLQTISNSGQSLLTIINDILDFSKIEAGKMDLETIPFMLLDVVEGSAQTIAPNAQRKGVRLITYVDPELPQFLSGDPVRIRQILINLGGNAIKFTEEGEVVIRAERCSTEGEDKIGVRFSVTDSGIGVSEEAQAKLFEAFLVARVWDLPSAKSLRR